ncbi:D-alanyl-D-alanine carboxypeptidase [Candidatus Azambacteria bacterium]|nr:D-alanyl-D-alanine carboxypeptidase [Candidatus Azambacteria bacterium]MBI3685079.1 D-alanyl-D-alanine carboxypeptidase [Candidatus Azambacteria bacterium]
MKNFADNIRQAVERLDAGMLNRIRIVSILLCALGFGVILHGKVFRDSFPQKQLVASAVGGADARAAADQSALAPRDAGGDIASPAAVRESTAPAEPLSVSSSALSLAPDAPLSSTEPFSLAARAAIMTNGPALRTIAYQKNADERFPIASLTKLMTAVVAVAYGKTDDVITVSKHAVATEGAAGLLAVGEKLTVGDMLEVMLVVSSNDAAVALEEYIASKGLDLIALMNEKAAALGMANTHFANPNGLDDKGHYASARDLAALTLYSLKYQSIWDILSKKSATVVSVDGRFTHRLVSNNELVQKNAPRVKGGKTGYTEKALGCMITVLNDNSVAVVLGSPDREWETEKLIELVKRGI